jgi:hypothetical protein
MAPRGEAKVQSGRNASNERRTLRIQLAGVRKKLTEIGKDVRVAEWFIIAQTFIILWPVYEYLHGAGERHKVKHYQAWQLIALSAGKSADGGRREALQDLHSDGLPLRGVDIAGAMIDSLTLPGASLKLGNLENATLRWADLTGTSFGRVNAAGAKFINARLPAADLSMATLDGAVFNGQQFARRSSSEVLCAKRSLSVRTWPA